MIKRYFTSNFTVNFGYLYIAVPENCEKPFDLCLVIDSSGSIRDKDPKHGRFDNWQLQLQFVGDLVQGFTIGPDATRVGAIVFSEDVIFKFTLSEYDNTNAIIESLNKFSFMGSTTNTPDALLQTRTQCFNVANGDRENIGNLAIIVTDGLPYPPYRKQPALEQAKALRNSGAAIVSVGITDKIDEGFLRDMSSPPQLVDQNYFTAVNFKALDNIRKRVVQGTCDTITSK